MNRTLVKVCGMTRPEDARLAAALGADMLGFIFHPKSPRNVAPELPAGLDRARDLLGALKVGVFVGQGVEETLALMAAGGLDLAQLHGGQGEDFCRELGRALGPERIIKVLWPERAASVDEFQAEIDLFAPPCRLFLTDAGDCGGGHGRTLETGILGSARFPKPWLLAGGLGPDNVSAMLSRFRPSGLDLNSGVESAPGIKDATKLREAFANIKAARAAQTKGENP
jgi:phosphoribosylanthranilate isomerase